MTEEDQAIQDEGENFNYETRCVGLEMAIKDSGIHPTLPLASIIKSALSKEEIESLIENLK